MKPGIQEQAANVVEEFFLSRTDRDIYVFLQEALEMPLVEKILGKTESSQLEVAKTLRLFHPEV